MGLDPGWKRDPEWPLLLLRGLGDARREGNVNRLVGFAALGFELAQERHLELATAICQIAWMTPESPKGALREGAASTHEVVRAVLDRQSEPATLGVAIDRLAALLAHLIDQDVEAAQLSWRAGEGFDTLDEPDSAGLAYQAAAASWLHQGRWQESMNAASLSVERFRESSNSRGEAESLTVHAEASIESGDLVQAQADLTLVEHLLPLVRSTHLRAVLARTQARVGIERGDRESPHEGLRRALRLSKRTDDGELQVVILHDLAILTESTVGPRASAAWWGKALTAAEAIGARFRELEIARGAALNASKCGRLDDGITILGRALERSETGDRSLIHARARADCAALVLTRATRALGDAGRATAEPDLERGEAALREALGVFVASADAEWAGIASRNLKLVWRLQGRQCEGSAWLRLVAQDAASPTAEDLMYEAALLGVTCPDDGAWATDWLLSADVGSDREAWAMALAHESLTLDSGDLLQDSERAVALMRLACEVTGGEASWAYGDLVNDLGVRLGRADRVEDARDAFEQALATAIRDENRALESLVLANLAEMQVRTQETEAARQRFARSAQLAEDVGDIDQAISSWAGVVRIVMLDDSDGAAEVARRMTALADQGASADSQATALSTEASMAFLRGAYVKASRLWRRAARLSGDHRGEHLAFALDALARTGDQSAYERELERAASSFARDSQAIAFSQGILRTAYTWVSAGDADAAGRVVAMSTALAGATLASDRLSTDPQSLFMRSLAVMHAGQLVIESVEEKRELVAEAFDRHLEDILGKESAVALRSVLAWSGEAEDTDDRDE
ncbi:MAG: hypothetical protein J0I14_05755 [Propionibacteriaceae bacterium]|nr:hypothetical protein [Propionibacteriaceae bacterium]